MSFPHVQIEIDNLSEAFFVIILVLEKILALLSDKSEIWILVFYAAVFFVKFSRLRYVSEYDNRKPKCNGVVLKNYLDHKFHWPQEDLNCKSLVHEVVT